MPELLGMSFWQRVEDNAFHLGVLGGIGFSEDDAQTLRRRRKFRALSIKRLRTGIKMSRCRQCIAAFSDSAHIRTDLATPTSRATAAELERQVQTNPGAPSRR